MSITDAEVKRLMRILNLRVTAYAVCGGALLAHHGLRENTNDIDILVLQPVLVELAAVWQLKPSSQQGKITPTITIDGVRIEAFASTNFHDDSTQAATYIGRAQVIDGVPYVQLADMLEWKASMMAETPNLKEGPKHLADIVLMRKALNYE